MRGRPRPGLFADGHTVVSFNLPGGTGVLTPAKDGSGVFAFSGATGDYPWSYGGTYGTDGLWTTANATAGVDEVYGFGDIGRTATQFGSVTGSFSGIPTDCPAPEVPAATTGNHGEYVSGATKAGIKGQALKDIAKNVALVGQYPAPKA